MKPLKRCPFCGGKATIARNNSVFFDHSFKGRVVCTECGAQTIACVDKNVAVSMWNRRCEGQRILLVEDGSVDLEKVEELGDPVIVYRAGSAKPEFLENKKGHADH